MTEKDRKKPLKLSGAGRLELKRTVDVGQVRQSFSHGRTKTVAVEVKRKRTITPAAEGPGKPAVRAKARGAVTAEAEKQARTLTEEERAARARAVRGAITGEEERELQREDRQSAQRARDDAQRDHEMEIVRQAEDEAEVERLRAEEVETQAEESRRKSEEEARRTEEESRRKSDEELRQRVAERAAARMSEREPDAAAEEEEAAPARRGRGAVRRPAAAPRRNEPRRRSGKLTVAAVLSGDAEGERMRSIAATRRARERERQRALELAPRDLPHKVIREVVLPEKITAQELANRMAERGVDVIRRLMAMGVMANINQMIDADTAELIVTEFGHKARRVSEADVELGLGGTPDEAEALQPRPPVVTIMGHVDHGKTSLLDALRETDVAGGEAGGITQHIGAYQVRLGGGQRITFLDTPGHAAFTAMRSRGAKATDIVVLVIAADDGVQPQTAEAINHARAARVPMIVAINKSDLPGADPARVRTQLLSHEVVTEEMGGDVLTVEVSATKGTNLDKLEEAILLQAEILELAANPDREAQGVVVESKLERGRGPVATVLIQRGTLRVGDIFIAGSEWGRVRALLDDKGNNAIAAGPSMPVGVLGLQGTPDAGEDFSVVENENRAREIAEFRQRRRRDERTAVGAIGSVDDIFNAMREGAISSLPVVVKADVQGSAEAIVGALERLGSDEVTVNVLHAGVGGINESDVTLAKASNGFIIGFNVRANPQAREIARRDKVDIRYYSIIYNVVDDATVMLTDMLAPGLHELLLGHAEIRKVFSISKVGKVAGCMVTDGQVRRGARVRVLRDDVVAHEGRLSSLKRFKDEVREVRGGFECGIAFKNYDDLREGDIVECFEVEEVARTL